MPALAFLLPVLAAFADATYLTVAKLFFRTFGKLSSREFTWMIFAWLVIVLLAIFPILGDWPSWSQVQPVLWKIGLVVLLGTTYNLLFSWGMEHERISEVQPFLLFNPLVAIVVAGIFYPDQRDWQIYISLVVAGALLAWTHLKRSHFVWSRGLAAICGFILLYALEVVLVRQLLDVFPPLAFYLVRCVLILILLSIVAPPKLEVVKLHHLPYFFLMASLAILATWGAYTAFQLIGIAHTLFAFVLSPVLVYWFSAVFLHEKWRIKNIIASIIIVGLVIWVSRIQ